MKTIIYIAIISFANIAYADENCKQSCEMLDLEYIAQSESACICLKKSNNAEQQQYLEGEAIPKIEEKHLRFHMENTKHE